MSCYQKHMAVSQSGGQDLKITVLTWPENNVLVHVSDFVPVPTSRPLSLRLSTMKSAPTRKTPAEKRSSWISHRASLQHDPALYDETLMSSTCEDEDGNMRCDILEGLTSNVVFMKLDSDEYYTAPVDRVLPGSVLSLLDAVLGKKLVYKCATLSDLLDGAFQGAFLTSTSRVLCPVGSIEVMETARVVTFSKNDYESRLDHVRSQVFEEMKRRIH
ncbi:MAG: hypothetical protein SGCHY_002361 [Lobulomycetales sp.]